MEWGGGGATARPYLGVWGRLRARRAPRYGGDGTAGARGGTGPRGHAGSWGPWGHAGRGGVGTPRAPRPRPTAPMSRSNWAIMGWESREVLALWDTPCPIATPADTPSPNAALSRPGATRGPPEPLSSSRTQPQHPHPPAPFPAHTRTPSVARGGPHLEQEHRPQMSQPGTQVHPCPPWVLTGCGSGPGHRLHAWHRDLQPVHTAGTRSLETPGATTPISHGDTDTRQCRHPVTRTPALVQARVTSRSQACSHQHLSLAVTRTPDTCCDTGT